MGDSKLETETLKIPAGSFRNSVYAIARWFNQGWSDGFSDEVFMRFWRSLSSDEKNYYRNLYI